MSEEIHIITPTNPPRFRTPHVRNFFRRVAYFLRTGKLVKPNRFAGWHTEPLEPVAVQRITPFSAMQIAPGARIIEGPAEVFPDPFPGLQPCERITREQALERWPIPDDDEGDFLSDRITDIPPDETPVIRKGKP